MKTRRVTLITSYIKLAYYTLVISNILPRSAHQNCTCTNGHVPRLQTVGHSCSWVYPGGPTIGCPQPGPGTECRRQRRQIALGLAHLASPWMVRNRVGQWAVLEWVTLKVSLRPCKSFAQIEYFLLFILSKHWARQWHTTHALRIIDHVRHDTMASTSRCKHAPVTNWQWPWDQTQPNQRGPEDGGDKHKMNGFIYGVTVVLSIKLKLVQEKGVLAANHDRNS